MITPVASIWAVVKTWARILTRGVFIVTIKNARWLRGAHFLALGKKRQTVIDTFVGENGIAKIWN